MREHDGGELMVEAARYPLGLSMAVSVEPLPERRGRHALPAASAGGDEPARYVCSPQVHLGNGSSRPAAEGDGVAQALVDVLRHHVSATVPGFDVVRLVPPPEATGERMATPDPAGTSVVVGERVVVKWLRELVDAPHPGPVTLAHLAAVDFMGIPTTHGMLLWRTPTGREVPCAVVTGYLPRARAGWDWSVDTAAQAMGLAQAAQLPTHHVPATGAMPQIDPWQNDFTARLGKVTAKLHIALAQSSPVIPEPVHTVDFSYVRRWHAQARRRLEQTLDAVMSLPDGDHIVEPRREYLAASIDTLLSITDTVKVQRIHADLHIGQILRWSGGLAVIDFDGNPIVDPELAEAATREIPGASPAIQPAARDVAQMLRSIDHVGRIVDKRTGFAHTATVDRWSVQARATFLQAYRRELNSAGHIDLFDARLLEAFEADQICRELLYAARHLRRWAYAPLQALRLMYPLDQG